MAKKEQNLKSYFSKKVSEPSVVSTSREYVMPGVPDPVDLETQDSHHADSESDSSANAVKTLDLAPGCSCQCCTITGVIIQCHV